MARNGRQDRNRRLRAAFTSQTAAQLREYAALLAAGGDGIVESVALELESAADRADALQMTMIAVRCRAAAARVRGGISAWSLRPVVTALATYGHGRAFPALVVVADPADLGGIKEQASAACEPMHFLTSTDPLANALQCEHIQGVLLPKSRIDEVDMLEERLEAPIYVYGEGTIPERLAAVEARAAGWVEVPIPLDVVLRRLRRDTWKDFLGRPRILVVADAEEANALMEDLEHGDPAMHVRPLTDPDVILDQLAEVAPEMVVLGANIGGVSGSHTLAVMGTDADAAELPVAVLGESYWVEDKEGVRCFEDVAAVAEAVRGVMALTHTGTGSVDRVTGAQSRPVILEAIDREMARARRSHMPVTAAAVAVDNLDQVRESAGPARADIGLRLASEVLGAGVRHYDLVGRVTADTFLLCLPDCSEEAAVQRLTALHERFRKIVQQDPELAVLSWSVGITDSEHGPAQLLRRVDDALERARARGKAGVITT
ncbi:MAG: GGDEF domain-containing protein [Deltaproteobacteria bacterium]|nr:MAG: GGDEF domain-containing protein [Deltaproteobacteria bacterium]